MGSKDLCDSEDGYESELMEGEEDEDCVYDSEEEDYGQNSESKVESKFRVLGQEDIWQLQEERIAGVCSILSVSKDEALALLIHFEWSSQRVIDQWLANQEEIRRDLGLLERPNPNSLMEIDSNNSQLQCGICTDACVIHGGTTAGVCRHYYCNQCWLRWIEVCIDDGSARCLRLNCFEPSCKCAIGREMVLSLLTLSDEKYLRKYTGYLVRSYVESNKKIKWCPAPGCEYALELLDGSSEVSCKCSHEFCWNCSEEVHRPVDCETVKKWVLKNNDNQETENWKLFNTKPCPKCGCAIEKNQGCMHMKCANACGFEFCWSCLRSWNNHGDCNGFHWDEPVRGIWKKLKNDGTSHKLEKLRKSHERYLHYFGRWADNASSLKKAQSDLQHTQNVQLERLSMIQVYLTANEVKFVTDAWLQIVECRRILKWTYAYGYFLPENDKDEAKIVLFEHLQGYAESSLERLHQCAEQEMEGFLVQARPPEDFHGFKKELDNLTKATHIYFENLVQALGKWLTDVNTTEQ